MSTNKNSITVKNFIKEQDEGNILYVKCMIMCVYTWKNDEIVHLSLV